MIDSKTIPQKNKSTVKSKEKQVSNFESYSVLHNTLEYIKGTIMRMKHTFIPMLNFNLTFKHLSFVFLRRLELICGSKVIEILPCFNPTIKQNG